jgi:hypothetical protein
MKNILFDMLKKRMARITLYIVVASLYILYLFLSSCARIEEDYPPNWIVASQYLPKDQLQGLRSAGFFEIGDSIYSHHCDSHGNMIRYKYDDKNKTWDHIKYETLGCIGIKR